MLPGPTTMYDISSLAVMDSINQRVLGWVELPSSEALETHGLPPSLGQNSQWWPDLDQRPTMTSPMYHGHHSGLYTTGGYNIGPTPTTRPPKQYALPNCREFLGRRIRWVSGLFLHKMCSKTYVVAMLQNILHNTSIITSKGIFQSKHCGTR